MTSKVAKGYGCCKQVRHLTYWLTSCLKFAMAGRPPTAPPAAPSPETHPPARQRRDAPLGSINAQQAKAQLSALLDRVERGEHVVITRRNQAIAELRPLQAPLPSAPRPLGQASDAGTPIPSTFFEPLPADLQAAFDGLVE
jgi:prevent-host-death family protein